MKLKTLRAVHVDLPEPQPKTPARRAPWPTKSPRAMPINFYPQYSRFPQDMPGARGLPKSGYRPSQKTAPSDSDDALSDSPSHPTSTTSSHPSSKAKTAWPSS